MSKTMLAALIGVSALFTIPTPASAQSGYRGREVVCASTNGRYRECRLPFRGRARLTEQLSGAACVPGRTWGQRGQSIWVNRGCRARFAVIRGDYRGGDDRYGDNHNGYGDNHNGDNRGDNGWVRDNNYSVECSTVNGRRTVCTWDNRYGNPRMTQQLSGQCVEGRNWGYDSNGGLWVDNDCHARFGYH
jgi:hypothetical protein